MHKITVDQEQRVKETNLFKSGLSIGKALTIRSPNKFPQPIHNSTVKHDKIRKVEVLQPKPNFQD